MQINWQPDLRAESELTRMGIEYAKARVPISKIDLNESQVNSARLERALLPETIEDYAEAFEAGDTFPMCVLTILPTGYYLILWGNQRTAAIMQLIQRRKLPKNTEIECYVTTPLDKLHREVVCRAGNVAHGVKASREERLAHALYCIQSLGMAKPEAARVFNVNDTTLSHALRAEETRRDLVDAGLKRVERLGRNQLKALHKLKFDSALQKCVATLVMQHDLNRDAANDAVDRIKTGRDHAARLELLRKLEVELTSQAKALHVERDTKKDRAIDRPRRRKLIQLLNQLSRFLIQGNGGEPFRNLEELQFQGEADAESAKMLAGKVAYRLKVLKLA